MVFGQHDNANLMRILFNSFLIVWVCVWFGLVFVGGWSSSYVYKFSLVRIWNSAGHFTLGYDVDNDDDDDGHGPWWMLLMLIFTETKQQQTSRSSSSQSSNDINKKKKNKINNETMVKLLSFLCINFYAYHVYGDVGVRTYEQHNIGSWMKMLLTIGVL